MDALAQLYKARYTEAVKLAEKGEERAALDILCELTLKVDLGFY